jgi:hypothetical protein
VIEALSNIRTMASLDLEEDRAAEYAYALGKEDPHPIKSSVAKGMMSPSDTERYLFTRIFFHKLLPISIDSNKYCFNLPAGLPNPSVRWYVAVVEFPWPLFMAL